MLKRNKLEIITLPRQMPWVGLCWGRWTLEDPERDDAVRTAHGRTRRRTRRSTQLRGPRSEIWSFTMKSPCCQHEIVIHTDPKNTEYVIISGALRKTEDFDVEDAETLLLPADEERDKLADPMYKLEHQEEDIRKKKEEEPVLVQLQRLSDSRHSDDYALNRALRDRLRSQMKRVAEEKKSARKMGLGVRLLPPSAKDAAAAASVKFASKFEKSRKDKRAAIKASSIFPESPSSASKEKLDLALKKRNIKAGAASMLMEGRVKPSSLQSVGSRSAGTHVRVLVRRKEARHVVRVAMEKLV